ncbi:MAG: 5-deoxy-glucuronate isomerase [bacterium]|nr:5-deoxy-glucuronate isomerase [bacterium]
MNLLYKYSQINGYFPIIDKDNENLHYLQFGILSLNKGQSFREETKNTEMGMIVLHGKCTVKCPGQLWKSVGKRNNVFEDKAYGIYIPCNSQYEVISEEDVEIAICKSPSDLESFPILITPEDIKRRTVGKDNWRRYLYDIIDIGINAKRLIIGETITPPCNWSTFPPQKHDINNLPYEIAMEELYFFKLNPKRGFGIMRVYSKDNTLNEIYAVEDNDTVIIPKGYHVVAATPGCSLYYLWVYAGEQRMKKKMSFDPDYKEVLNFE